MSNGTTDTTCSSSLEEVHKVIVALCRGRCEKNRSSSHDDDVCMVLVNSVIQKSEQVKDGGLCAVAAGVYKDEQTATVRGR